MNLFVCFFVWFVLGRGKEESGWMMLAGARFWEAHERAEFYVCGILGVRGSFLEGSSYV